MILEPIRCDEHNYGWQWDECNAIMKWHLKAIIWYVCKWVGLHAAHVFVCWYVSVSVCADTHRYVGVKSIQHSLASTCALNGLTMFARNRNKKENNNTNQKRCKEWDLISSYGICSCTCHIIFPKQFSPPQLLRTCIAKAKEVRNMQTKRFEEFIDRNVYTLPLVNTKAFFTASASILAIFFLLLFRPPFLSPAVNISQLLRTAFVHFVFRFFAHQSLTHAITTTVMLVSFYFILLWLGWIRVKYINHYSYFWSRIDTSLNSFSSTRKEKPRKKNYFDAHDMHCECENWLSVCVCVPVCSKDFIEYVLIILL